MVLLILDQIFSFHVKGDRSSVSELFPAQFSDDFVKIGMSAFEPLLQPQVLEPIELRHRPRVAQVGFSFETLDGIGSFDLH